MKNAKTKRQITMITLLAALGAAVYLNWEYAKTDIPVTPAAGGGFVPEAQEEILSANAAAEEELPVMEALPDKNYGDAQLVSAAASDLYFEQARLTRTKTRDHALDTMQQALRNAALSDTEKNAVTQSLTREMSNITLENSIENIVKSKGFTDCVAFIDGERINLAVRTGDTGLDQGEVACLRDIILGKTDTSAQNISIVEVK